MLEAHKDLHPGAERWMLLPCVWDGPSPCGRGPSPIHVSARDCANRFGPSFWVKSGRPWDSRVLVGVIYQAYKYCMSLIFIGAEHPQIPLISLLEIKYAGICLNYHLLFDVRRIKMNRLNVAICCCQTERPFIARERAYHWESSMDQWMKQSL